MHNRLDKDEIKQIGFEEKKIKIKKNSTVNK
jgi:hypothetical protein